MALPRICVLTHVDDSGIGRPGCKGDVVPRTMHRRNLCRLLYGFTIYSLCESKDATVRLLRRLSCVYSLESVPAVFEVRISQERELTTFSPVDYLSGMTQMVGSDVNTKMETSRLFEAQHLCFSPPAT